MKKILFLLFVASFCMLSCDYIKDPIENTSSSPDTTGSSVVKRNILLEEFTGQKCQNCPDGARRAEQLEATYSGQIIIVEINAGYFAKPDNSGDFTADYRSPAGDIYNNTFSVSAYPAGMISRVEKNGKYVLNKGDWEGVILNIKDDDPIVKMDIKNSYDNSSRKLNTTIKSTWLKDGTTDYKLVVYITEDHLIGPQQDGNQVVPDYDHRHTLRASMNSAFGTVLTNIAEGDEETNSFSYTLPSSWDADNCSVVAYIYDSDSNSPNYYEVYQVEKAAVK